METPERIKERIRKHRQLIRLPNGYINLNKYGYGGQYTEYYANAEGKVISVYHGLEIKAKFQKVCIHKRDKQPIVRLQKMGNSSGSFPVSVSTIKRLVTTGKSTIQGRNYLNERGEEE